MLPTYTVPHDKIPELIGRLKDLNCVVLFQSDKKILWCSAADAPNKTINVYFMTSEGEEFCYVTGVLGRKKKEVFAKFAAALQGLEGN